MTATAGQMNPKLVTALEDIDRWRQESDADADREHNEISEEQERLHREIEERQASLEALATRKSEVESHKASLPGEQLQRRREATLKNLAGDRGLVAARGSLYGDQVKARERRVQELIDKPQYNKLVKEYEEFQDVEMGLDALPKTYKQAILAHHGTVKKELAPVFDAMAAPEAPTPAAGTSREIGGPAAAAGTAGPRRASPAARTTLPPPALGSLPATRRRWRPARCDESARRRRRGGSGRALEGREVGAGRGETQATSAGDESSGASAAVAAAAEEAAAGEGCTRAPRRRRAMGRIGPEGTADRK